MYQAKKNNKRCIHLRKIAIFLIIFTAFSGSDAIVTVDDNIAIFNKINSNNKKTQNTTLNHFAIVDSISIKNKIKNFLGV